MDRKYRAKYYEELQNHFAEEGFTEELNEGNFIIPEEADYVDMEDDEEAEMFYFTEGPHCTDKGMDHEEKEETEAPHCMDKTKAPKHSGDPGEMQEYVFVNKDKAIEKSKMIGMDGVVHEEKLGDGTTVYIPGPNDEMFNSWYRRKKMEHMRRMSEAPDHYDESMMHKDHKEEEGKMHKDEETEAPDHYKSYGDKHVKLNKPFRTPDGPKKFSVYVKNEKGNVVKVNFGDPNMEIRRDDPDRRRNFRARHQCDTNPGPKWKARYWSCKMWSTPKVSDLTAKEHSKDVFTNPGEAMKRAKEMGLDGVHSHKDKDGNTVFMPGKTHKEYMDKKKVKAEERSEAGYKYEDPRTGEVFTFKRRGVYKKNGRVLVPVKGSKPGLWENIRKKKEREGKNYKPARTEKEGRPSQEELKRAQSAECPAATKNVELNTKNRNATIENHMYGPLNVDKPGDYWKNIADKWDTTEEAAKNSLCGNCVAFDISPQMKECMPGEVSDDSGQLGYCWMHHFKCHSKRTCDTWAKGGPITKNEVSDNWQEKSKASETSEALQYGKPPKNDPRKTPAPKKDQKRGSKKNKPDSAKKPNKSIKFSKEVTSQLSNMVKEHNAKGKGSKATLGALKAVYRRGAGAYSTSHAPKMSRHGWAIARVKAFLYLLRNGRPSNPNYKQDNDLLPKSHPRSKK